METDVSSATKRPSKESDTRSTWNRRRTLKGGEVSWSFSLVHPTLEFPHHCAQLNKLAYISLQHAEVPTNTAQLCVANKKKKRDKTIRSQILDIHRHKSTAVGSEWLTLEVLRWCPRSRRCEQEPRHGYDGLSCQSWPAILREDATLRPFPLELEYAGEAGLAPYPVSHKLHNLRERRNLRRSLNKRHPFDNVKCRGKRKEKKSEHATARYKPQSASVSAPTTSTSAYRGKH